MKVAVLCEYSGVVRDAFIRRGHYEDAVEWVEYNTLPALAYMGNLGPLVLPTL